MMACTYGSAELVNLLLSAGADCTCMDNRSNTVYHAAAVSGNDDILQLLIRFGGDLQGKLYAANKDGKTPLLLAVERNYLSTVAIILALMPKDRQDIDKLHQELLHTAAYGGYLDVCKMLIENGCDPRLRGDVWNLPLHLAAKSNKADVVQYLLEIAPDTIEKNNLCHITPFHAAVMNDALETVKVLVEHGANILFNGRDGETPIIAASKNNAVDVLSVSVLC
ncbi:unnamed protein product [Cylicostephanus goldi]|uniref:Uncharacterized protein n=1 Tax=Cylicostephanus goldi TaxID=71465 RepID=A0A3P7M2Y6_CYLGO|nr:unnamed protein product [Cylicostephanus goldi]